MVAAVLHSRLAAAYLTAYCTFAPPQDGNFYEAALSIRCFAVEERGDAVSQRETVSIRGLRGILSS
jgi:hypothetical protein